ncbi:hypothetical protein ACE6ED_26530 [Paenibacillus sp. CN-4]|uniref:hypothetical protein n=1 Tax=Paenibacillus nanchangensis TaxID=3348343 RepID=UPI0039795DB6
MELTTDSLVEEYVELTTDSMGVSSREVLVITLYTFASTNELREEKMIEMTNMEETAVLESRDLIKIPP